MILPHSHPILSCCVSFLSIPFLFFSYRRSSSKASTRISAFISSTRFQLIRQKTELIIGNYRTSRRARRHAGAALNTDLLSVTSATKELSMMSCAGRMRLISDPIKSHASVMMSLVRLAGGRALGNHVQ